MLFGLAENNKNKKHLGLPILAVKNRNTNNQPAVPCWPDLPGHIVWCGIKNIKKNKITKTKKSTLAVAMLIRAVARKEKYTIVRSNIVHVAIKKLSPYVPFSTSYY